MATLKQWGAVIVAFIELAAVFARRVAIVLLIIWLFLKLLGFLWDMNPVAAIALLLILFLFSLILQHGGDGKTVHVNSYWRRPPRR